MLSLTPELMRAATGCTPSVAQTWARPLSEAARKFGIVTAARWTDFLAQVGHESSGFTRTVENLNYQAARIVQVWPHRFRSAADASIYAQNPRGLANTVYGGRLGNVQGDDGWRFIGRGLLQVTGRANYAAVTDLLREAGIDCPDFTQDPAALAEPRWAALSAAAWWKHQGLNELSDRGEFTKQTIRINGGTHGLDDRMRRRELARAALMGLS